MINIKPLAISVCLTMLFGVVGCNKVADNNIQVSQGNDQVKEIVQERKIIPSFEVKTYSTPFIEFNYPADWIEQDITNEKYAFIVLSNKYDPSDQKNFIILNGDLRPLNQSAIEARVGFENSFKGKDIEVIDNKTMLNNYIAVLEFVDWGKLKIRNKCYFYSNGNGKSYMINIYADKDHWDKYQEVIKVFEQSLKFK